MTLRRITETMPKLHLAGPVVDGVQACTECGTILVDTTDLGRITGQRAFHEGELVARNGRVAAVVSVGESAAYEPCRKVQ